MNSLYTRDTKVAVLPFSRQQEGEETVIGNPETGVFLAVPQEVVEMLDLLALGKTSGEVSDLYLERTGETPDLDDLLGFLETKGLVRPKGPEDLERQKPQVPGRARKFHFGEFPQSLARFIFSVHVLAFEAVLAAVAVGLILRDPSLMPVPLDMVFNTQRAWSWTLLTAFTYGAIFAHELAHLVAARAVGVKSRIRISHRLWFLVAETDLTGLWSVPKNQRYLPMLAGIIIDATVTSVLILLLFAARQGVFTFSALTLHLLRAMFFTNLMRIFWEFFLFVRTDIYFVAATFLNCKNLMMDTQAFLQNQVARVLPRVHPVDQSGIPPAERRAIRAYAALFLAGRAWAFFTLFWVTVPVCIGYWGSLIPPLRAGYFANPSDFLDALAASTYFLVPTVAGFVFWANAFIRPKGV